MLNNTAEVTQFGLTAGAPRTLTSAVFNELHSDILSARLRPGQKLHIGALADRFSVSLGAIREALSRLVSGGLVEAADQKGFRVYPVSVAELKPAVIKPANKRSSAAPRTLRSAGSGNTAASDRCAAVRTIRSWAAVSCLLVINGLLTCAPPHVALPPPHARTLPGSCRLRTGTSAGAHSNASFAAEVEARLGCFLKRLSDVRPVKASDCGFRSKAATYSDLIAATVPT